MFASEFSLETGVNVVTRFRGGWRVTAVESLSLPSSRVWRRRPHCHYLHAIIFSQTLPLPRNDDDADGFFTGRVMRVSQQLGSAVVDSVINMRHHPP